MRLKSKNDLLINMTAYAILQIVNMFIGLFLPRLYLAVYGSEINGIISTINSFTTYFSYLEAGLGLTLIHSLFKPLADNDIKSVNSILSYSKKQYQKISGAYFILVVLLSLVFPCLRVAKEIGKLEFSFLVFVLGLYGAVDFYSMAKYRVLLTADRKEYVISNAMILAQVLRFVFVWLLLKFNISVVIVKIIPIFTLLVRSIVLKVYVEKKYPKFSFSLPCALKIPISKERWDALLFQVSISTSVSLPTIIISQVLGYKEANVFAVYSLIITAIISIISALSSGVSPMLGRKIAQKEEINAIYNTYDFIVSLVITIAFSVTVVLLIPFVVLYTNVVGDVNYVVPVYAVLCCVWGALYSYRMPVTAVVNAAGLYQENRVHNMVNLLFQIIGGIIVTILWGTIGLLILMILAALHRNIALSITNSRKLSHAGVIKYIIRQFVMALIIIANFYLLYSYITNIISGVETWVLVALIISCLEFFICAIIFTLIDLQTSRYIIETLKAMLKKKANGKDRR